MVMHVVWALVCCSCYWILRLHRQTIMAASSYGGFEDLDLLMDRNLHQAVANSRPRLPIPLKVEQSARGEQEQEELSVMMITGSQSVVGNPFPGAASISLALNSVLSSSLFFAKSNETSETSNRGGRGPAVSPATPSLRKSHSPVPVMPSSKVQVTLDIQAPTAITKSTESSNFVSTFPEYDRLCGPKFKDPGYSPGLHRASIVWFRNDLRVHDNEALVTASRDSLSVLPVFCFDPRDYGKSTAGFDKTGPYRAQFLLECVANLRSSLQERGSDLFVRIGQPEQVLVDLAKSVCADCLYVHQEVTSDELKSEEKVSAALQEQGVETKSFWGSTLFHIDDLPFKLQDMPSNYGGFREKVQNVAVRDTILTPHQLKGPPAGGKVKPGNIPSLQELGLNSAALRQDNHPAGGPGVVGGEGEALSRLQRFALDNPSHAVTKAKVSNSSEPAGDSLYGADFSCKISPWLSMGCLSPRRMFEDLKNGSSIGAMSTFAVKAGGSGEDNRLVFELLWRDFFRFITKKYGVAKRKSEVEAAKLHVSLAPV